MEIPQSFAALGANQAETGDFREKLPQNGAGPALVRSRRHFEASRPFVYGIQLAGWSTEKTHGKSSRKCNRVGQLGATGQEFEQVKVARNQGFFLCPTPTFDLMLGSACFFACREFLSPYEFNRKPLSRPSAAFSVFVLGDSLLQFVGTTCVVGTIGATEDVCKERFQHRVS
jgi:hypothetical protein